MSLSIGNESFVDVFLYETLQNIEELEILILHNQGEAAFSREVVQQMFRILHTIKGSAAMMSYMPISHTAHALEDVFSYLREDKNDSYDTVALSDLILATIDFIKMECTKISEGQEPDGNSQELTDDIYSFLETMKQHVSDISTEAVTSSMESVPQGQWYRASVRFEEGCEMLNVRAFALVHQLTPLVNEVHSLPEDLVAEESAVIIAKSGLQLTIKTSQSYDDLLKFFESIAFLSELDLQTDAESETATHCVTDDQASPPSNHESPTLSEPNREPPSSSSSKMSAPLQTMISVSVEKLDKLMDLVGEMVIAESMVTHHPELQGIKLINFHRDTRQLHKITTELKEIALSIRMVPLTKTFHKMHRVIRDVAKKLEKDVEIEVIGDDIEVDKNIIEHISDPIMHLVRNAVDHGLESIQERLSLGKQPAGTVTLEAQNSGGYVLVSIRDDGRGLDPKQLIQKAIEKGLLHKPANEMSEQEAFNLIFMPGFSTKKDVSEFSGRGVGMDVVAQNIEAIGGSVLVDSQVGHGTSITLKIPTTLAIIDGMNVRVGRAIYTIPTTGVIESFRPVASAVLSDPDGREMIMVRGQAYSLIRLHRRFGVRSDGEDVTKGIVLMVMGEGGPICIAADELVGTQQVVVKELPTYIQRLQPTSGLAGCTLLGDGSISLIINTLGLTA